MTSAKDRCYQMEHMIAEFDQITLLANQSSIVDIKKSKNMSETQASVATLHQTMSAIMAKRD